MENVSVKESIRSVHEEYYWSSVGNIKEGRGDLGEEMPVHVYRLMQLTMLEVLSKSHGAEQANEYFRQAGHLAGNRFARETLDLCADFITFVGNLRKALEDLKIGKLEMEAFDADNGNIILSLGQDLDCSGTLITDENVCIYDEGFIAGILEAYTGMEYNVREVDCCAKGNKVCRFNGMALDC